MQSIDLAGFESETPESAAGRHLAKIRATDVAGPEEARCSTTEAIMVALALCNRAYLPNGLQQTHAAHLWWRLDDSQRVAVQLYAASCKGEPEVSAERTA